MFNQLKANSHSKRSPFFRMKIYFFLFTLSVFQVNLQAQISQIFNSGGDGAGNGLNEARGVCADSQDNIYVVGRISDNVLKRSINGVITQVISSSGDGLGNTLDDPYAIICDHQNNLFVAGNLSDNVFKITPTGTITEIIDSNGDGMGNTFDGPRDLACDSLGNIYVACSNTSNIFKITPSGTITEIIDATGDGNGKTLYFPLSVSIDPFGNVFTAGYGSHNVFKITPTGIITEILNAAGDGMGNDYLSPVFITTDYSGNVFASATLTDNVFKISPSGDITVIIDGTGDGNGNTLNYPVDIATSVSGALVVAGMFSDNVFKVSPGGTITEIIDSNGDGINILNEPRRVAISDGNVYVSGMSSNNVFLIPDVTLSSELSQFQAQPKDQQIHLSWTAISEQDHINFDIQRSSDGLDFRTIGSLNSSQNINQEQTYRFVDKYPNPGVNYYRLAFKNQEGNIQYSDLVSASISSSDQIIGEFFPNPSSNGQVQLDYFSAEIGTINIKAFDSKGSLVLEQQVSLQAGSNRLNLNFPTSAKGLMTIHLQEGGQVFTRPLMIH